jgi:hypothetical protein
MVIGGVLLAALACSRDSIVTFAARANGTARLLWPIAMRVNPAVVEAVQACARELEAQASLQTEIIPHGSAQNLQGDKQPRRGARLSGSHGALPGIVLVLLTSAGWCQHLYTCFNEGRWGFMIAGAILSPIGVMHGWGVWIGWW